MAYCSQCGDYGHAYEKLMNNRMDLIIEIDQLRTKLAAAEKVIEAVQNMVHAHYIDATCKDCTGEINHVEQLLEKLEQFKQYREVK